MISSVRKFPLRTKFLRFQKQSKQVSTPHLRMLYNLILQECDPRLSVIIPKKVSKLATTRNWLKRLAYDAIYPELKDRKIDCVTIFKPLPLKRSKITKEQISNELIQMLKTI